MNDCYQRIEMVERALRLKELTSEQRTEFEMELDLLKTILKKSEEQLTALRKENTRTGIIAAAFIFICFLLYGLQVMYANKN